MLRKVMMIKFLSIYFAKRGGGVMCHVTEDCVVGLDHFSLAGITEGG